VTITHTTIDDRRCTCRYGTVEGLDGHEGGCPMRKPPPVVPRDLARLAHPVAAVTGGDDWTSFEADYQVGDYLGQPRLCGEVFVKHPDLTDYGGHRAARYHCTKPQGHALPHDPHEGPRIDDAPAMKSIAEMGLPAVVHSTPMRLLLDTQAPAYQLTEAEAVLVADCKRAEDETAARKAIDRFLATVYDGWIDDLAAKRLVVTRRLGH